MPRKVDALRHGASVDTLALYRYGQRGYSSLGVRIHLKERGLGFEFFDFGRADVDL